MVILKDFLKLEQTDLRTGEKTKLEMPATSNVLQYFCADGTKVSVRPSGTEPKIKFYIEVKDKMTAPEQFDDCEARATAKLAVIRKEFGCD